MDNNSKQKIEKRFLINCTVRNVENWLKTNAEEGWLIERMWDFHFQFKKAKPCRAEFLVLENFPLTNEYKLMSRIREEFFACSGTRNIGHADAALYSVYCVEIEQAAIKEIQEVRRKRNRFMKGQAWLMFGFFVALAIISIVSTICNQEPFSNNLPLIISTSPFTFYSIMVIIHLSGKKSV